MLCQNTAKCQDWQESKVLETSTSIKHPEVSWKLPIADVCCSRQSQLQKVAILELWSLVKWPATYLMAPLLYTRKPGLLACSVRVFEYSKLDSGSARENFHNSLA